MGSHAMAKRPLSLIGALALAAGVLGGVPAVAQDAAPVTIPAVVQIDDPVGDANGVNDQDNAYGTAAEGEGDHVGPAGGTATDILKVWFSNTPADVSLNIQVNADPRTLAYDTYFRFSSNAGEGPVANDTTRGCLQWIASVNGAAGAYNGPTEGSLTDKCNVGDSVTGPLVVSEADTGFVITITFPRSYSPLLSAGGKLTAPFGVSRILYANGLPSAAGSTAALVTLDNTKRGTDYVFAASATEPTPDTPKPPKPAKPGKGKPQGCDKGKGKKKGCKPVPPPPASCAPYVPGDNGKEAPVINVTDAATAESPVVVEFDAGQGLAAAPVLGIPVPDTTTHTFHNIQVDSASPEVGLYVRLEFADRSDYDLYLQHADGTEADHSGDFNSVVESPVHSCGGTSCSSGSNFEEIDGIATADCGGWTTDTVAYLTQGGNVTMKVWLGEVKAAPATPE